MVVEETTVGDGLCRLIRAMMVGSSKVEEVGEVGSSAILGDIGPRPVESPPKEGSRMGDTRAMGVSKLNLGGIDTALGLDGVSRLARTVKGGGTFNGGRSTNTRRWWSGVSGRLLVLSVRDRWRTLVFVGGELLSVLTSSSRRFDADSERLDLGTYPQPSASPEPRANSSERPPFRSSRSRLRTNELRLRLGSLNSDEAFFSS